MNYNKSKVTILIPCKNEGEGLREIIRSVKRYASEIIVIDSHSQDNSKEIAYEEDVKFILDHGLGKGDAVRLGLKEAKNKIVVVVDADGAFDIHDIPKMVNLLSRNQADLVVGSSKLGGSFDFDVNFSGVIRTSGADFMTALVNNKFKTKLTDILYGFKAIKRDVANKLVLKSNDFAIDQEIVVSCLKNGFKVLQVPSTEKKRVWGESKLKNVTGINLLLKLLQQLFVNIEK